jgi:hypothetical protein
MTGIRVSKLPLDNLHIERDTYLPSLHGIGNRSNNLVGRSYRLCMASEEGFWQMGWVWTLNPRKLNIAHLRAN